MFADKGEVREQFRRNTNAFKNDCSVYERDGKVVIVNVINY